MKTPSAHVEAPRVKGWCPGALRPMQTGDGLIVRVRPRCGALQTSQLIALAQIASRYGNSGIDLTRRANLQLRGIDEACLPQVWDALAQQDLIDASADAEAVRNVIVSPFAGFEPTPISESVLSVATALETLLSNTPALWALPGKFCFVVDGGGMLALDSVRADIRLKGFVTNKGRARFTLGVDARGGTQWLRIFGPRDAGTAASRLAQEFLRLPNLHSSARMRDVEAAPLAQFAQSLDGEDARGNESPEAVPNSAAARVGLISFGDQSVCVGIGAPLGRLTADALLQFAQAAASLGIGSFRVSPWRALYARARSLTNGEQLLIAATRSGFVTDSRDPLLDIDACPGAPACRSAWADTRDTARRIAAQMPLPGITSVHVSGCTKGCARSAPADLVLVAEPSGFAIVRRGTASSTPQGVVTFASLDELPAILRTGF